jgi:hypothetical protein
VRKRPVVGTPPPGRASFGPWHVVARKMIRSALSRKARLARTTRKLIRFRCRPTTLKQNARGEIDSSVGKGTVSDNRHNFQQEQKQCYRDAIS